MQTFLPYNDFYKSVQCLDYRRLGKQRVEAKQIYNALQPGSTSRWRSHVAVRMWKGCENALLHYMNTAIEEWVRRGYNNNMNLAVVSFPVIMPFWFGDERLHASHRGNLLRKNFKYYSQFGWNEPIDMPYWWPVKRLT